VDDGALRPDADDDLLRETTVCRDGEVVHPRVRDALGLAVPESTSTAEGAA
jgi:H+-translocating NAD(P) transhydrogenase subunit alpha